MWLQYSVGGISGALAGLTGFYLLKEIVIERERRSIILMLIYILIGMLGGLICSHLTVNIKESLLMIIFGFTLFMGATIDKYYLIMPDEGAVFLLIVGISRIWLLGISFFQTVEMAGIVLVGGYLFSKLTNDGLGLGDVKWCSVFTLWLSPLALWQAILLALIGGTGWVFLYYLYSGKVLRILPFGPFLCSAAAIMYIWENLWSIL